MASIIRKLVSGDKFRFKEDGFDLDLTYIKHNIIAMGLPGEHLSSLWRNNSHKVAEYLNTRHGTHYMIYNLSGEKYDYSRYNHQVREFGFPDHHPPPLQLYLQCVEDAARWLAQNSENVVVVHCLAGRSRTGTIIAGLLLYLHDFEASEEAIRFFNSQRSSKESDIVLPSQIRYVGYFERLLQSKSREELFDNPKRIMLKQVIIEPALSLEDSDGIGGKFTPVVFVDELQEPHKLLNKITYETFDQAQCNDIKLPIHTMIAGDIRIRFCHKAKDKAAFTKSVVKVTSNPINVAKSTKQYPYVTIFRVSFNTNYVDENTPLVLEAKDLDAAFAGSLVTAKSDFVPPGLRVVLIFGPLDSTVSNNYIEEKSSVEQKLQQPSMMSANNPSSGVTFIPSAPLTYPGQPVIYGAPPSNLKKVVGRVHSVVRLGLTKRNHTYRYDD